MDENPGKLAEIIYTRFGRHYDIKSIIVVRVESKQFAGPSFTKVVIELKEAITAVRIRLL